MFKVKVCYIVYALISCIIRLSTIRQQSDPLTCYTHYRGTLSRTTLGKVPCPTAQVNLFQRAVARLEMGSLGSESSTLPTELVLVLYVYLIKELLII